MLTYEELNEIICSGFESQMDFLLEGIKNPDVNPLEYAARGIIIKQDTVNKIWNKIKEDGIDIG